LPEPENKKLAKTKHGYDGFKGALNVDLTHLIDGKPLYDELSKHVKATLDKEIRNQAPRLKKIKDWEDNYSGVRAPKDYPWPNSANVCVPLTRSDTDAVHVRLVDAIFNKRKLWMIRALKPEFVGIDRELEDALDWFQLNMLDLKEKLQSPLIQCIKTGTGMLKIGWQSKKKAHYRYAKPDELANKEIPKFPLPGTKRKGVLVVQTLYEGPQVYSIPREDWVCSSDATCIEDAYLCGFKTPVRLPQIELRAKQGLYDKERSKTIQTGGQVPDEVKEGRVARQGKETNYTVDESKPIDIWEIWMQYDVDGDGEPDDIVITMHRETGTILRCVYNPMFLGFRPFVPLVFYPQEYSVDGEGIAEILEKIQYELDALHNQRLDRITQINSPVLFVRSGSNLEKLDQLEPGKIYVVDDDLEQAVREFRYSDTTFSTYAEEDRLLGMGDRAVGITPNTLGINSAERPVAKDTFANIQEANKKFQFGIDNLRKRIADLGYMLLEFFAQYQPEYSYVKGEGKELETVNVGFPTEYLRDGLNVQLYSSSELMNQETRREIHLTLYTLLSDYYSKTAGMVQAIIDPEMPSEFKKYMMSIVKKGDRRIELIMKEFDQVDSTEYTVNLEETIDTEKAIANSVDLREEEEPDDESPDSDQPPTANAELVDVQGPPQMPPDERTPPPGGLIGAAGQPVTA